VIEQRRHARAPIDVALAFSVKGRADQATGVGLDIGLGGMLIETSAPAPFGAEVIVHLELPGVDDMLALPGVVRWVRAGRMGVQFGLLGAVETHAITELTRSHAAD
jgi:Tfp pilus assembly protein PilZ